MHIDYDHAVAATVLYLQNSGQDQTPYTISGDPPLTANTMRILGELKTEKSNV